MLKRTPLRPKKNYTLKRTPLKTKGAGLKRSPLKTKSVQLKRTPIKKQNEQYKKDWEEARKKRLETDGGKCVVCKKKATQVHHIHLRSKRPDLILNQNNLRSLCNRHHFHMGNERYQEQCELLARVEHITVEELLEKAQQPDEGE